MAVESLGNLLSEAATLMITGMAFVFAFLALLIGGVKVIAWFCQRYPGAEAVVPVPRTTSRKAADTVDGQTLAAIAAAIHQHRNK